MRNLNQRMHFESYSPADHFQQPLVAEEMPALLDANLIDSLEMDGGGGGGGHDQLDSYAYQASRERHRLHQPRLVLTPAGHQEHFLPTSSAPSLNNNSLALYRLLNFIDQSMPSSGVGLDGPVQVQAKTSSRSYPYSSSGASSATGHPASSTRSRNQNNRYNQHKHQQNNRSSSHHQANAFNSFNNFNFPNNQQLDNDPPMTTTGFGSKQQTTSSPPTSSSASSSSSSSSANNNNYHGGASEKLNGALTSSSMSNLKVPHDADGEIIASNNAPRCDKFTPDICVDDFEYPEQAIIDEIQKKRDVFELMYSEVKDNEPLVDGIPRDVEESYNYDYYYYGKTNGNGSNGAGAAAASSTSLNFNSAPATNSNLSRAASHLSQRHISHPITELGGGGGGGARHPEEHSYEHLSDSNGNLPGAGLRLKPPKPITGSWSAGASSAAGPGTEIDGMDALIGAITPYASSSQSSYSASGGSSSGGGGGGSGGSSAPSTGFICPSEVMYGKPKLAKNKKGLWKVIVNAGEFTQTVRLEKCLLPNKNCNYVSALNFESRCAQVHSYHRLLVFEKGRGFYIDTFRLPTGCNCHVTRRPQQQQQQQPHSASSLNVNNSFPGQERAGGGGGGGGGQGNERRGDSSFPNQQVEPATAGGGFGAGGTGNGASMLSQTLWSILSGGGGAGGAQTNHAPAHHQNHFGHSSGTQLQPLQYNTNNNNSPANYLNTNYPLQHLAGTAGGGGFGADSLQEQYGSSNQEINLPLMRTTQTNYANLSNAQRSAYHSQSAILEHLSQNPTLATDISNSVLKQLIYY